MKTLILRLLLLVAGIFSLSIPFPAHGKESDKEKIETLRTALQSASGTSKPVTIEATFDKALQLINLATKTVPEDDRFEYAGKTFLFRDDGPGKETSYILHEETQVRIILFEPAAKTRKHKNRS